MKLKVAVLKGVSTYNVLRIFADVVAAQLETLECDVELIDLVPFDLDTVKEKLSGVDYIFTFNLMGIPLKKDEYTEKEQIFYSTFWGKPLVSYLVDHPMYHYMRLETAKMHKSKIVTFDRGNVQYIKNRYGDSIQNTKFLPCFGIKAKNEYEFNNKDIDLLFVGSYHKPVSKEMFFNNYKPDYQKFIFGLCDLMVGNPDYTMEKALIEYMIQKGIEDYKDDEMFKYYMGVFCKADAYIRSYYRDKLITVLLESGLEISVYGNGWDEYDGPNKDKIHIIQSSGADLMDGIELMARAKAIIGMVPWFKDGIQDRILNTMYNNAVCITDPTPYLKENFTDNENIVFYDIKELAKLPDKLRVLFADEQRMSAIAANGKKIAEEKYSQEEFARQILELMKEA